MAIRPPAPIVQPAIVLFGALACVFLGSGTGHTAAAPATPTAIAQVPLTVAIPAHPQIVFAIGNSQSMDGDISGAIMTGSGALAANLNLLQNTSSPVSYAVPGGFTPPLNPGGGGLAPYTVTTGGTQYDNSASRLNVAKAGLTAILNTFMPNADFALLDYSTSGNNFYTTWLYQMSPTTSGFVFSNTITPAPDRWVANPCYHYNSVPGTPIHDDCLAMDTSGQVQGDMNKSQFMQISASSDDPLINDVLYWGGAAPVCIVYGGPNPPSPYTGYTLGTYVANPNNVLEFYNTDTNGPCATVTGPTNAGYVPFTPQTMYVQRGFGYLSNQTPNSATTLVPMTSAGATPTAQSVATAIAQFTPFLAPETSDLNTSEIKATAVQSSVAGLLAGALNYYNTANPPSSNGCAAQRYVVLVTDGLPTLDLNGGSWPPPGTVSATQWNMQVAFNADQSLNVGATTDQAVIDTINQLAALQAQGINTYIIGLGAGVDTTVNPVAPRVLTAMAIAGGTGSYFAAQSPTQLTQDMQVILAKILAATQSTSSTAVNSTGLHNGSVAYLAQFTTSDNFQDWTGNLNAWAIDPSTGQVNTTPGLQIWSAKTQLAAQDWDTGRLIATWDPVSQKGTPFRWNPGLFPAGISANTNLGKALSTFLADTNGQDVLQFIRGSNAEELRNLGQFRNRTHKLGDIVASAPLYVGPPNGLTQTADYFAFATANQNRSPVIYVGANDGMLHAFDAATGNERFAYVPNGVFNNLVKLVNPYYNQQHQFFVNGSPRAADVKFAPPDGSWHTVLVSTEGAGGSTVFALDVTAPDSLVTEALVAQKALWEFTDTDMGLSFSEPAIVSTAAGWMVIVGNGYNSPNQKPVLYGLNPQTGAIMAKVDLCAAVAAACNKAVANGLSSVAVVNSYGQVSAQANVAYAGDLQGNVWRIDISDPHPANWIVSVLYQTLDPSGVPQPITTVPAVTLNPHFPSLLGTMVYVGTGALLGVGDLNSTQIQSMYGLYDPPTGATPPVGFAGIPTRANLQKQVLALDTVSGVPVRTVPNPSTVPLPPVAGAMRGWYIDLSLSPGERIITDPEIESGGGVVFTTYVPNSSECTGGGSAWLMVLNFATGAAFPLPELDVNGNGVLDKNDLPASGHIPVGMSLGPVYASTPTLLPGGGGIGGTNKLTSVSSGNVDSVLDRGRAKQRISWWEVRH